MGTENKREPPKKKKSIEKRLMILVFSVVIFVLLLPTVVYHFKISLPHYLYQKKYWHPLNIYEVADTAYKTELVYGKNLIANTAKYLGPNGIVKQISNGMNCQNCHLAAGTVVFGINYGSVASIYPKFRARSGTVEPIYKRVNDCFERSLNGKSLDTSSREMKAILAYIQYIGSNTPKGEQAFGSGLKALAFMDRAADPLSGKLLYMSTCQRCHQRNGQGLLNADRSEFVYPPLWGQNSFNDGAGMYRISNLAKFIKSNMPQGTTHNKPVLSNDESWDIAAFILSQKRPHFDRVKADWPDIKQKPVDYPFAPYADSFSEQQHKFGPFKQMQ